MWDACNPCLGIPEIFDEAGIAGDFLAWPSCIAVQN
jgi:hypothetical protein